MRVLLDTHTCLWALQGDPQLSVTAYRIINERENEILLSVASLWEMAIKVRKGSLIVNVGGQPFAQAILADLQAAEIGLLESPRITHSPSPHCRSAIIKTRSTG
jgi:PIN domain nuclease of toxin-antitoxin system